MIGGWVVEAAIRYTSNGVATMSRDAQAANMLQIRMAQLRGEITAQEASYLRLQNSMASTAATRSAMYGRVAGGAALGSAAVLGFAIVQAANMERAMLNLKIATNSSREQMDAFRESIYRTAAATAQSAPTIAAIYGSIASTSGLPASSLTPEFLSRVTKFAEIVQMKSKGTAHEYTANEAAMQLIELAHQYRAYTPNQIGTFAEMLHKATYFMPGGLSQFLTQSKYFTPLMALSAGNADAMQQSILLGILLQQTGLGRGRGGTGVAAFERQIIQGLAMTSHAQGGRRTALRNVGLIDASGNTPFVRTNAENQTYFDVIGALRQVQKYADEHTRGLTGTAKAHEEEVILRNVLSALGVQGSLVALVAAGGGIQQMANVQKRMQKIPSISQDQLLRLQTFWGAVQRAGSGLESLGAALGSPGLSNLTPKISKFADAINRATLDLEHHPQKAGFIFNSIALVTGIAALGAAARFVKPALKFVGEGLLDIGKAVTTTGKVLDNVFLRGVGQEMLGTITAVGKAAATSSPALRLLGTVIARLVTGLTLPLDILAAFDNAKAEGPVRSMNPYYIPYMRKGAKSLIKAGGGHTVVNHIGTVQLNFHGPVDEKKMTNLWTNPLSELYTSGQLRTHANIPPPHTVKPR